MSGPTYRLNSVYKPTDGSGTIRITFPDLRRSNRKNADALVNKQIASLMKNHPGSVISAHLREGTRYASSWYFELSAVPKPAKLAVHTSLRRK